MAMAASIGAVVHAWALIMGPGQMAASPQVTAPLTTKLRRWDAVTITPATLHTNSSK